MLLFQKRFHEGLVSGDVTVTFRRWAKCRVKPGGRYRCHPLGVLEVDAVERVRAGGISAEDARRAGFGSREELMRYLDEGPSGLLTPDTPLFRVELHHGGDGDRVPVALDANLDAEARTKLDEALAKLDSKGPWTLATLRLIRKRPRIAASALAAELARETAPFKADVCKLKRLGLTQSFEVGYELSPRGEAYLEGASKKRRKAARS